MAATPSSMLALGTSMPSFSLRDVVAERALGSDALDGRAGVLVMFVCNHCPYVVHVRSELVKVAHEALERGFSVVAINSNSERTHPQDGPASMRELARAEAWRFPFLFDQTQAVARSFTAACTPDLFLFDSERRLAYRGQLDDARPGNGKPVTGRDLRAALAALALGKRPTAEQRPSLGCNIKWD